MTDGRCLCGAVTFDVTGEPLWVAHCHCESCRRQTGSMPATYVGYRAHQVSYPGAPPREFESSPGIFRGFCGTCGSAIHYRPSAQHEIHHYIGVYDDPARYRAARHVFYEEHVEGYELADNLARFNKLTGTPVAWGKQPTYNILFICHDNAYLSILAEAITNRIAKRGVRAFSAGSTPLRALHPRVVDWLNREGFDVHAYRSKSWDEFMDEPVLDWVISLGHHAETKTTRVLKGDPRQAHWQVADAIEDEVSLAEAASGLADKIKHFINDSSF